VVLVAVAAPARASAFLREIGGGGGPGAEALRQGSWSERRAIAADRWEIGREFDLGRAWAANRLECGDLTFSGLTTL
jgi:hypothetical protein